MDTEALLTNVDTLIKNVHWFEQDLAHPVGKSHKGTAINYVDIQERRNDFLRELRNTICNWVYSKKQYEKIFSKELGRREADLQNISSHIDYLARSKFRKGHPQGQFGELLLFNFLQYFFKAPPLLRKMSITTSVGHERFGSDAIHYRYFNKKNKIYLGESKAYKSKYKFKVAFEESISSIVNSYNTLQDELLLYVYDDFIDPDLQLVADEFKEGTLKNVRVEMVCMVAYNENNKLKITDEEGIKEQIESITSSRLASLDKNVMSDVEPTLAKRIHYVIFPIWDFDELLGEFDS